METKSIAHFRTGIGNFILFTPALQALASMDESGKIDLCTDPVWTDYRKNAILDIWERLPFVNKVYSYTEVDHSKYNKWFWTHWTSAGYAKELFESKKYYDAPSWDKMVEHESDYYMRMLRENYGYIGKKPKQCIVPAPAPILDMQTRHRVVFCNGGFGDIGVFKKWPYFAGLAFAIKHYFEDTITIKVGANKEMDDVKTDVDYVDKLTITETAKVIQQADVMVTTDTGNMHIADALGIPIIALWGGSAMAKNMPIQAKTKIINLGLDCQPCMQEGGYRACLEYKCMTQITVGEVMYHLRCLFGKGKFDDDNS